MRGVLEIETEVELAATVTVGESVVDAIVMVGVEGECRPARWGYDGGSPEESPEATILSVHYWDESGTKREINVATLPKAEVERIEGRAVEAAIRDSAVDDRSDDYED